jgi:N-methylhydantoinase B
MTQITSPRRVDPVTFEVLRSGFRAMCTEGSALLRRVAYHPTITEGQDFSVALLTADGRMVGNGHRDQTPHFGSFEATVRAVIEDYPELDPGDAIICNDPHRLGTHTLDVRIVRPIFREDRLVAFAVALCHWADCGGVMPGTFYPAAVECYAEGLHMPPLKIFAKDEMVQPIWKLIELNLRTPWDRIGDLLAQLHACKLIEKRLNEYMDKFGKQTILDTFEETMDYSERMFRQEVATLPDGTYEFEDYIDHDEGQEGHPAVRVVLKMTIDGDNVTYDFTETEKIVGPAGLPFPGFQSASYDGTLHIFAHLAPLNHGIIRAIELKTTPGTAVHVVRPIPTAGYCAGAYEKVDACVMACWAQAFEARDLDRVYAGTVNLQNICLGGTHPETGVDYVSYTWVEGGQGALVGADGPTGLMYLFISGAGNQPIEIHERFYPWLYTACEVRQDTAGDGKFRGGNGVFRNWKVLGDCLLTVHGDRSEHGPYSLDGGTNGGPSTLILNAGTDTEQNLGMYASGIKLGPGDHITFGSNGGGGIGRPWERDAVLVLEDVLDDFISLDKARDMYGVVIEVRDEDSLDYVIDSAATEAKRAELVKSGGERPVGYAPGEVHPYGDRVDTSSYEARVS